MQSASQQSDNSAPAESTHDRVLLAAGPIFAEKGFRDATIREICHAADVNLASVNYHFRDKRGLYHETVLHAHQMQSAMFPIDFNSDAPPAEKLEQFVFKIVHSMAINQTGPWQVRLLMNEIQNPTDTCRQLARDHFRPFVEALTKIVQEIAQVKLTSFERTTLAMSVIGQCMIYRFAPEANAMIQQSDAIHPQQTTKEELQSMAQLITSFSIGGIEAAAKRCSS